MTAVTSKDDSRRRRASKPAVTRATTFSSASTADLAARRTVGSHWVPPSTTCVDVTYFRRAYIYMRSVVKWNAREVVYLENVDCAERRCVTNQHRQVLLQRSRHFVVECKQNRLHPVASATLSETVKRRISASRGRLDVASRSNENTDAVRVNVVRCHHLGRGVD